jgi:hypothetical protein
MFDLNLPAYDYKIRSHNGKNEIFDPLRRRFVALTPEEWVRQHFTNFLLTDKGFPAGRMVQEAFLPYNDRKKRCDTVVYDASLQPLVLIEYKAPTVEITQKVFDQISAYNVALHVNYLIVSNGLVHYCCQMDYASQQFVFLNDIPSYGELH